MDRFLAQIAVPPPLPQQEQLGGDVDLDGPRGADEWYGPEGGEGAAAAVEPPAAAAAAAAPVAAVGAADDQDAETVAWDGEDDSDSDGVDDVDARAGSKRRRRESAPLWQNLEDVASALLGRSEAACRAADQVPPFVRDALHLDHVICGKVPAGLVRHPASVLDGVPARIVYAERDTDVSHFLGLHGVRLGGPEMPSASAFFNAIRDALRRLLVGKDATQASVDACKLELQVAAAAPDTFIAGNLDGILYVNLSHLPSFKSSRTVSSELVQCQHRFLVERDSHAAALVYFAAPCFFGPCRRA